MSTENTFDMSNNKMPLISCGEKIDLTKNKFSNVTFNISSFVHSNKSIRFFHTKNDYLASRINAENDFYESEFLKLFSFFNTSNGCVLDIGGNIGNHSVFFSAIKGWQVIAFEPVVQNTMCLAINADLNNVSEKISIIGSALGKTEGNCDLSMTIEDNFGSYSRVNEKNAHTVSVPVKVLDNIPEIKNIKNSIGLVKIDVEGMEYDVLQGSLNTLELHKPALALECTSQSSYMDIMNILKPLGYFPIEILNATATFVFINKYNNSHIDKLSQYLSLYVEQRKLQYQIC